MNMTGLSLDQAPPFRSVARFFVTAPVFGALFGLMVAIVGSGLFDRFAPDTVAIVHLFTIGFLLMSIFGALAQMLPVLAGVKVARFDVVGLLSYIGVSGGAIFFFLGFYLSSQLFKQLALYTLFLAVMIYLISILIAILRQNSSNFTVRGMGFSAFFGLAGLGFGLHLLAGYAFGAIGEFHISAVVLHIVWVVCRRLRVCLAQRRSGVGLRNLWDLS